MKEQTRKLLVGLVLLAVIFGTGYVAMQQQLRQSANDVPTQLAEQAKKELGEGKRPQDVLPNARVSITSDLTPFMIIYDSQGNPIVSSFTATDGKAPIIPFGVLTAADQHSNRENKVTWQPGWSLVEGNKTRLAREAVVVVATGNDAAPYVLAGASLRLTEDHITQLGWIVLAGWLLSSLVWLGFVLSSRSKKS